MEHFLLSGGGEIPPLCEKGYYLDPCNRQLIRSVEQDGSTIRDFHYLHGSISRIITYWDDGDVWDTIYSGQNCIIHFRFIQRFDGSWSKNCYNPKTGELVAAIVSRRRVATVKKGESDGPPQSESVIQKGT